LRFLSEIGHSVHTWLLLLTKPFSNKDVHVSFPTAGESLQIAPHFGVYWANFQLCMRTNGHISTSGLIFAPNL